MTTALLLIALCQCGPGGCPSPTVMLPYWPSVPVVQPYIAPQIQEPVYSWYRIRHEGLSFQVWGFKISEGNVRWRTDLPENMEHYRDAKNAASRKLEEKPKTKPANKEVVKLKETKGQTSINYGVEPTMLNLRKGQHYTANSYEAESFVSQTKSNSAHGRIYVTVIGDPEDRKKVSRDWHNNPVFDGWRDKTWFQEFEKNEWQVKDELGYRADGSPTILVQKPDGGVLLRMGRYSGPRPILAALRKADPSYAPSHDPGADGTPADSIGFDDFRFYAALGAIFVGALLILPRRRK